MSISEFADDCSVRYLSNQEHNTAILHASDMGMKKTITFFGQTGKDSCARITAKNGFSGSLISSTKFVAARGT